jgi:hypothetical protein
MTGRLSWFDTEQLLPGERLQREAAAELLTRIAPYRWHGALVLTSARLFFLPEISNALIEPAAFWLEDIAGVARTGRHRIHVSSAMGGASFALEGAVLAPHDRATWWLTEIDRLKSQPTPIEAFEPRRRAG